MTIAKNKYKKISDSKCCRKRLSSSQDGFTLVEVIVGLVISAIVMAVVMASFTRLSRAYTTQNVSASVQQITRTAVDFMTREIRMAGLDPHGTADAKIEEISADKIYFSLDLCNVPIGGSGCGDPDGDTEDVSEIITYEYLPDENRIRRCLYETDVLIGTCETLIDNVVSNPAGEPLFTYFDSAGAVTNLESDLRSVMITLTVEEPAGGSRRVSRTYTSQVICRNLDL